ncbi:MAG: putative ferredoxin, partial [Nitrososphaeraceae archaeon]|nr:putative ferredoxin [Nitrososphaeraceae archaeon]
MVPSSTEYICADCGSLLGHSNPLTLQSMKDIHNQLCIVKRTKILAESSMKGTPPRAVKSQPVPSLEQQNKTSSIAQAGQPTPTLEQTVGTAPSSSPATIPSPTVGNTTISLTGSGTDYPKVDGPIDPSFKTKRQNAGTFQGIKVWGPVDPP